MTKRHGKTGARGKAAGTTREDIAELAEAARRTAVRSLNAIMTATYWAVGRRIVDADPGGRGAPDPLLEELAGDLVARFGRAYSVAGLRRMQAFYRCYAGVIGARARSGADPSISAKCGNYLDELAMLMGAFPLPWSHYLLLIEEPDRDVRDSLEAEAVRGGWSERELSLHLEARRRDRRARTGAREEARGARYTPAFVEPPAPAVWLH